MSPQPVQLGKLLKTTRILNSTLTSSDVRGTTISQLLQGSLLILTSHQDVLEFCPNLVIVFLSKFGKQLPPKGWQRMGKWQWNKNQRVQVSILCPLTSLFCCVFRHVIFRHIWVYLCKIESWFKATHSERDWKANVIYYPSIFAQKFHCNKCSRLMDSPLKTGFKKWLWSFPGGAVVEILPANAGDTGSSPGLGRYHMPRSN